jgi:hypothetical protein
MMKPCLLKNSCRTAGLPRLLRHAVSPCAHSLAKKSLASHSSSPRKDARGLTDYTKSHSCLFYLMRFIDLSRPSFIERLRRPDFHPH